MLIHLFWHVRQHLNSKWLTDFTMLSWSNSYGSEILSKFALESGAERHNLSTSISGLYWGWLFDDCSALFSISEYNMEQFFRMGPFDESKQPATWSSKIISTIFTSCLLSSWHRFSPITGCYFDSWIAPV